MNSKVQINKLYEAVLEMPYFEHYDKKPIELS